MVKSCFETTFFQKVVLKPPFQNVRKKLPWKCDNKNLYMAACSQLSYYLVTEVEIDNSFVYKLSILMIETEFMILALKKLA